LLQRIGLTIGDVWLIASAASLLTEPTTEPTTEPATRPDRAG
jgi:hypothetical protein